MFRCEHGFLVYWTQLTTTGLSAFPAVKPTLRCITKFFRGFCAWTNFVRAHWSMNDPTSTFRLFSYYMSGIIWVKWLVSSSDLRDSLLTQFFWSWLTGPSISATGSKVYIFCTSHAWSMWRWKSQLVGLSCFTVYIYMVQFTNLNSLMLFLHSADPDPKGFRRNHVTGGRYHHCRFI